MARTPEQYAALARFAGLTGGVRTVVAGCNPDGSLKLLKEPAWKHERKRLCAVQDFKPDSKPQHMMLVLEGLAKKVGWFTAIRTIVPPVYVLEEDVNLAEAVCQAAEACMESNKE